MSEPFLPLPRDAAPACPGGALAADALPLAGDCPGQLPALPEEGLGHALRTPLTALHGALGLLGAGLAGELPPDARALVSIALRNCTALEQVVEAHLGELLDDSWLDSHPSS